MQEKNISFSEVFDIYGFRIIVPDDPALLGWHLDLTEVTGATTAKMTVRRDRLPPAPSGTPAITASSSSWPSGSAWSQTGDFTGVAKNADGTDVSGHQFVGAIGPRRPLQPIAETGVESDAYRFVQPVATCWTSSR